MESFNDTYNRRFFRRQWFRSYVQLRAQSKNFEIFHNRNHRYGYSKAQPLFSFLRRLALNLFWFLLSSRCLKSPISLMGLSRSFASFAVIVNWISGENILNCLRAWFTRMLELKSLPNYMRFRSFMERIWWSSSPTIFPLGLTLIPDLGKRYPDIKTLCPG